MIRQSDHIAVLAVHEDARFGKSMAGWLREHGFQVEQTRSANEALSLAERKDHDVAILGLNLPDMDGLQLLSRLRSIQPGVQSIILTSKGSIPSAVQAMRLGAYSYLTRPCKLSDLELEVKEACLQARKARHDAPANPVLQRGNATQILGTSAALQAVLQQIRKMALSEERVLIQGESGTGKELVARELHAASSRADGPFVAINCAAIQESLLESELFGHEKGAFTSAVAAKPGLFEMANEGTLFIDEIGEMRFDLQSNLLRVLEDGRARRVGSTKWIQTNVRVITATNKDLALEVAELRFRQDLFYRLSVLTIKIPPFRERREDIPLLVQHFLSQDACGPQEIEREALQLLMNYDWPGNVRELENVIKRAKVMGEGTKITIRDLPEEIVRPGRVIAQAPSAGAQPADTGLDELEKQHIQSTLNAESGNKSRAAARLNISRQRLYRLIQKFGLSSGNGR